MPETRVAATYVDAKSQMLSASNGVDYAYRATGDATSLRHDGTATVTCVGIATIAAAVGAGGLGEFIFRGVASVDNRLVLAGAVPAALLALAADGLLGLLEWKLRVPGTGRP